jgi:hypothetical protein
MESPHRKPAQDDREHYEAPAAQELGRLEDVTEGVIDYPSCERP